MGLRKERMADEIRDLLAQNFQGGVLNDPRLESVTITAVNLSADLQVATVYFRTYEEKDAPKAQRGLQSVSGRLRKHLGKSLDIRRVPELRFIYDKSLEDAAKVETILQKITRDENKDEK